MHYLHLYMYDRDGIKIRHRILEIPTNTLKHLICQSHMIGFRKTTPQIHYMECFIYTTKIKGIPIDSITVDAQGNPYYGHIKPALETIDE